MTSSIIIRSKFNKLLWKNLRTLHNNSNHHNFSNTSKVNNIYYSSISVNNNVILSAATKLAINNFHTFSNNRHQNIFSINSILNCAYSTKPKSKYDKATKIIPGSTTESETNVRDQSKSVHYQSKKANDEKQLQQEDQNQNLQQQEQEKLPNDILFNNEKLGLFAKFKLMYKQYWYVLIPVHVITSIGWFGGFYYLSKSGVDIPSLLQTLHISESIIEKLKGSTMGHLAVAYLCYKIATPARYAVTVGGTTISIKYLVQAGHIKPMPTKKELMKMYEDRKEKIKLEKENKESRNQ